MKIRSITPERSGEVIVRVYEVGHATRSRLKDSSASMETLPLVLREIGSHHRKGTPRPRSRHFSTVRSLMPKERPASSIKVQSSEVVMTTMITDASSEMQRHFDGRRQNAALLPCLMDEETDEQRIIRIKKQVQYLLLTRDLTPKAFAEKKEINEPFKSMEKWVAIQIDEALRDIPERVILKIVDYFDLDYELLKTGKKRTPKSPAGFHNIPAPDAIDGLLEHLIAVDASRRKPGRPKSIRTRSDEVPRRMPRQQQPGIKK